jgi:hypothetical protein
MLMITRRPSCFTHAALGVLILVLMTGGAMAQNTPPQSAALAKQLAAAMDAGKLMTVAAKDSGESFVAAMYFSGSQLLVVSAAYEPSVLLLDKLMKKDYQEVYIDLNSAAKAGTRVFIEDLGADGLEFKRDEGRGADSIEQKGKPTRFDDQWRRDQKMSDETFAKLYADADKEYARLLQLLINEAKK